MPKVTGQDQMNNLFSLTQSFQAILRIIFMHTLLFTIYGLSVTRIIFNGFKAELGCIDKTHLHYLQHTF